jgi:hypothetical protein
MRQTATGVGQFPPFSANLGASEQGNGVKMLKIVVEYLICFAKFAHSQKERDFPARALRAKLRLQHSV